MYILLMANYTSLWEKSMVSQIIRGELMELSDDKYKAFHSKLMPTIQDDLILGVRVPVLRKYARKVFEEYDWQTFLKETPHKYYEENNLHAFIIEQIKDYQRVIDELNLFLPFVDNWATCDSCSPKIFKKHLDELLLSIDMWISSEHTYMVRFGIEMLMTYYLDELFCKDYIDKVLMVKSDEYYINMMIAWFMATALAKQWDSVISYLENDSLSVWVHNKTIQKAVESYRISDERKQYLKTLRKHS